MNKLEGIIYKETAYKENSKLLQVITKKGKISLIARGSQKINSDLRIITQQLNYISFSLETDKKIANLKDAKLINDFKNLKDNFESFKYASLPLEIISKIYLDDSNNEKIFELLLETLNHNDIKLSALSFALKVLYYLGYGMDLKGRDVVGFNIILGRVVFKNEEAIIDLNLEDTIALLKITYMKITDLEEYDINTIKRLYSFLYRYYLEKTEIRLKTIE